MPEAKASEILDEASLEIILNFKPTKTIKQEVSNEILKLKSNIKKAISVLSKEKQEILELRYYQNLSLDKIAEKISKPKNEVIQTLSDAVLDIQKLIKSNLVSDSATDKLKEVIPVLVKANSTAVSKSQNPIIALIVFALFFATTFYGFYYFFNNVLSINNITFKAKEFISKPAPFKDKTPGTIDISGSSSVLAISKKWQENYMSHFKDKFNLISSDSDRGIDSLIIGNIDIANSSRPVTFFDQQRAAKNSLELIENRVALDALIIIVNAKSPLTEISLDDLKAIFSTKVKNWNELVSKVDLQVMPIVRERGSGTNEFAINRILEERDFPETIPRASSSEEIISYVSQNEGAISFLNSTNYPWQDKNIKYLKVKNYDDSISISPFEGRKLNKDALRYGDYPLAHYLYLITLVQANSNVQKFVEWVLGSKGQKIVTDLGLISITEEANNEL